MTSFDSIADFFSPPDPSISQEGSVDPMGLLVIWQDYARRIFQRKLNSVATDPRAFMINILHHSAIASWLDEHPNHEGWPGRFECYAGLLIWAEDLLAHAFLELEALGRPMDAMGILGLSKLKGVQATTGGHRLIPLLNRGVLKNQLALGYTGRYKASMIEMNLFDTQFLKGPKHEQVWQELNVLINKSQAYERYRDAVNALFDVADPRKEQRYQNLPETLRKEHLEAVEQAFQTTLIPPQWRALLRRQIGLEEGAAGAIAMVVKDRLHRDERIDPKEVLREAQERIEPQKAQKLKDILWLEPVLAHVDWFFDHLLDSNGKPAATLEAMAQQVQTFIKKLAHLSASEPNARLKQLWKMLDRDVSAKEWIKGFIEFHQETMNQRGGITWVSIGPNGNIKQQYLRAASGTDKNSPETWRRGYYVHSVESMMRVLR